MKKSLILFLASLFLIGSVSAYYGEDLVGSFFDSIGRENLFLIAIFIISFILINWPLSKVFKDEYGNPSTGTARGIALASSLLITGYIHFTNFNIEDFFFEIGVSTETIVIVLPIILLAGLIFFSYSKKERKFKFQRPFLIFGGFFIILSFFVYEKFTTMIIGIISLAIGIWLWKRKKHPKEEQSRNYSYSYSK